MAELKYCPDCKSDQECVKKGKNADGKQYYSCKTCGKKFLESKSKTIATKKATKKVVAKKTVIKSEAKTVTTKIIVNNNTIKSVKGAKPLTKDQAYDLVSPYFKEIAKEKATVKTEGSETVIEFKVTAGTKGR